jgi:hypothetical protein
MTLTIELTPEEEAELRRRAKEEGLTQEAWMHQLLRERLTGPRLPEAIGEKAGANPAKPMTGAEALAFWKETGAQGVFADRPEDSPELARKLRKEAETRDWSGA